MFLFKPFQILAPNTKLISEIFPSYKLALQNYPQIVMFLQPEKNLEYISGIYTGGRLFSKL